MIRQALAAALCMGLFVSLAPTTRAEPSPQTTCVDVCASKRGACDNTCEDRKTRCVIQCGVPLLPGYDKCRQTCDDNLRACSLGCVADEKICQVRCKAGQ
jgi:hypothetical protein